MNVSAGPSAPVDGVRCSGFNKDKSARWRSDFDMAISGSANCLAPGTRVAEFRLQDVLGEGGFGIVYRALDLTLDRTVAVKEFLPATLAGRKGSRQIHVRPQHKGTFDAGLRSFINEARWLAKFSHPALVHVYRFFEDNGTAYMVMRHYEGQTLGQLLEQQPGTAGEPWLLGLLSPIMDVLELLHAADFFHRDIAPDNIFLQADGLPVLLDFGAARRIIGDMTQALTMVLKPGFAPVEQYVDDGTMAQGPWTDIYQLGAVIFLAMTGQPPATSVARMIKDPVPAQIDALAGRYSPSVLEGLRRALAVNPQDRVQTIAELRSLLGVISYKSPRPPAWEPSAPAALDPLPPAAPPVVTPAEVTVAPVPAAKAAPALVSLPAAVAAEPVPDPAPAPTPPPAPPPAPASPSLPPRDRRPGIAALAAMIAVVGLALWWQQRSGSDSSSGNPAVPVAMAQPVPKAEAPVAPAVPVTPAAPAAPVEPPAPALPAAEAPAPTASGPASAASSPRLAAPVADPAPAPAPAPVPAPVPKPAPLPAPPKAPVAASAVAKAPLQTGKLLLRVLPWGSVWVNRKSMGTTPPLTQIDLPPGRHTIEVSNPSGPSVTGVVLVKEGESVVFSHDFEQGSSTR